MNLSELGVVVIGRNEGERLLRCLNSVRSHAEIIIYVDSGSSDGSPTAAAALGVIVVNLDLSIPFTAARARNAGAAALMSSMPGAKYIQFIDGDCEIVDGWLRSAVEFLDQREQVAVVCGRRRERNPDLSVYNRLCDIEWNTPVGETLACGGDALVRVKAFNSVGGFRSESITGEEPEMCVRLREKGWKIWRLDAEMTRHDAGMTQFRQWWLRAVRGGFGIAEVYRLHSQSRYSICGRDKVSAVFWGGIVPITICVGSILNPAVLILALIYPLQIFRIAFKRGPTSPSSWQYAFFVILAKFGEFQGISTYYWRRWRGKTFELIEYK